MVMGADASRLLAEVEANRCREVQLNIVGKTAELIKMIEALRSNTSVEKLIMAAKSNREPKPAVTTALVEMLAANRSIKQLQLSDIHEWDFARAFAVGLQQHTILEGFRIEECRFSQRDMQAVFEALQHCTNLRELDLKNSIKEYFQGAALGALCALLQSSKALAELNVASWYSLEGASLSALLDALVGATSLRKLNLRKYMGVITVGGKEELFDDALRRKTAAGMATSVPSSTYYAPNARSNLWG